MGFFRLLFMLVLVPLAAQPAQKPGYNLGRTPTNTEIRAWDIAVGPEGKELPPGSGTAREGQKIYTEQCAYCHGATGTEGLSLPEAADLWPFTSRAPRSFPPLVGKAGTLQGIRRYPYATTIWDYTNRAMPPAAEGSLSADDVYALTAFMLYRNGIISENQVIDAQSLPKIHMPNRDGRVVPPWPDWWTPSGDRRQNP